MYATRKALVGVGTATLLATGGVSTSVAQTATDARANGAASAASARDGRAMLSAKVTVKAKARHGKASSTFKWKGQNRTSSFKTYINDTNCDERDAFAFLQFRLKNGHHTWVKTGDSRFWDRTCGNGGKSYTSGRYITSYKLTHVRVVVCKRTASGDTCKKGHWKKNTKL